MKYIKFLLIPILTLLLISQVQAVNFSLFVSCISPDGIFFGYESDGPFQGSSSVMFFGGGEVIGRAPSSFAEGHHEQVFGVKLAPDSAAHWEVTGDNWSQRIYVDGSTDAPDCPPDNGTGQPDGGIFEITAYVAGVPGVDRCTWEIRNHGDPDVWDDIDGSTGVEIDPEIGIIFCRLPLGKDNLDHDPANYRATVS
jgi:hypothetical protein